MPERIFILRKQDYAWGDYGDILVHGMTRHLERKNGLLQLERAGLFVPAVTLPGIHDVVLTTPAKEQLIRKITNLQFRPVSLARIVKLDWQDWDRSADEPPRYPPNGEPEEYILDRPHEPDVAEALGELWELVPELVPDIQLDGRFNAEAYSGQAFVCADGFGGYGFVSEELKEALEDLAPEWITFGQVAPPAAT